MRPLGYYSGIIHDFGLTRSLRLWRNAFENKGKKDPEKFSGYIELSTYCRQRCIECYVASERNDQTTLDSQLANEFIRQLHRLGTTTFAIVGGEPLEDLTKDSIISIIEDNPGVVFYLCTNGHGIDDEVSRRFSKSKNLVFALSTDGFKENNDRRRGHGAFETIVEASKSLRHYKNPIGVYVTVNSLNFEEISSREFIDFLRSLGMKYATFQRHFPQDSTLAITDEQYVQTLKRLHKIAQNSPVVLVTPYFGDLVNPKLENRYRTLLISKDGSVRLGRTGPSHGNLKYQLLEDIITSPGFLEDSSRLHDFEGMNRDGNMAYILQQLKSA